MRVLFSRALLALLPLLPLGCTNPKTPPAAVGEAGDAAPPAPLVDATDAGASAVSSAPSSATAPSAPSVTKPKDEPVDACTAIGVDFEKRLRPKLKDCYREGKTKDPDLKGSASIAVNVDTLGKVSGIRLGDHTLPEPVAQCMLKVVKAAPLTPADAARCSGKSITIPLVFPTPH